VAEWKGQSKGSVLGYKIFVILLEKFGLTPAYFILRFVALYYFLFAPSSFKNIYQFYRRRCRFGFLSAVLAVYRNYYAFGQVILDKTATMAGFKARFSFDFEGEQHLRAMAGGQTGGLLISAHIGNFEMAGHMLERLNARVNIVMLDAEHQRIKNYLTSFTHRSFSIIPLMADNAHIYEIHRALENREILCMHGDRFMKGSKVIKADFMGKQAAFPSGPFYLAMKYNVPVSFVFAMKAGKSHYHFYATPPAFFPQQPNPLKRNEMLSGMVRAYIGEMEAKLKLYPYQWFNYYNFWEHDGS
jgi:predicted LPLAT superfamily acyltransferase